jgi:hypothetical protein
MARGGARPGAGRPARKSANTSPVSARARPRASRRRKSKAVAGRQGRDDAPAAPEHPVSQTGDLWCLGRHRLLCGDSTVATDVERVLGDVEPHLMVTDPPYGVNYDPAWRNQAGADCRPARRRASAPRSSPQRPSRGSRRCRAAGQRGPSRGPQSGRRPRPPAPASSIPTP